MAMIRKSYITIFILLLYFSPLLWRSGGKLFAQYAGGNADGHSMIANETYVASCSLPANFNIYKGGDGSVVVVPQSPTCVSSGSELILNGDFSAGNTGFTSAYTYILPNTQINVSKYTVSTSPATSNPGYWQGSDHTTGTGNFMLVDGAGTVASVWCQTINVLTNTDYAFSAWLTSLHTDNPAQLQMSINGINIGNILYAPAAFNTWVQVGTLWNSGSDTTADICIVNQNTAGWGNDFGLDDISFHQCGLCYTVSNVPTVTAVSTNLLCSSQCIGTATATATGGSAPYTYSWNSSPMQTTKNATGLCAGTYSVLVTDANSKTDTAAVTIIQPAALTASVTSTAAACINNNGTATITPSGGTAPYVYIWNNGQTNTTATGLSIGDYTATVTDTNGCIKIQSVSVAPISAPIAFVSASSYTIVDGDSTMLTGSGGVTYQWSPSTGLSCSTCANPTATPNQTTDYCVTVADANGCTGSDCVTINIGDPCGTLYIPNAFSPNNDLENDLHCVLGGCIETFHITIYDRWGEMVFESTDQKTCWDGMYKGKLLNTAVFVYDLKATLMNGEKINKKGNISLLR
ncbi:MAG: gliding motility-associated C-terminal domain-containing protein [Bacteroidetes bacterium]|nr:gliding motility-associated C-terminal domain-containing protein [Bacteroidota bacterium]